MASTNEKLQRPAQRLPAPSLFVGPPSRPASAAGHRPQINRLASARDSTFPLRRAQQEKKQDNVNYVGNREESTSLNTDGQSLQTQDVLRGGTDWSGDKQSDALWAELQNTLEEVELSAASRANVFSVDHARALEDLRKAQIELAQAWARSEAEDEGHESENLPTRHNLSSKELKLIGSNSNLSRHGGDKSRDHDTQYARIKKRGHLEEETESDITLARQRRLANDQYFDKVNKGVVDVVAKLEVVANKMRDLETESQDIWASEQDSLESSSMG